MKIEAKGLFRAALMAAFLCLLGCANLGDGEFNPAFSDEFHENFGNGRIDVFGVSLPVGTALLVSAEVIIGNDLERASSLAGRLERAASGVAEFEKKYAVLDAQRLIKQQMLDDCGWREGCRQTVELYFAQNEVQLGELSIDVEREAATIQEHLATMLDAVKTAEAALVAQQ